MHAYSMYVLFADKVSCPMTQRYDTLRTEPLYFLSPLYICKYDVVGGRAPFFSLDETQEQYIGHCEGARKMLGVPVRYF